MKKPKKRVLTANDRKHIAPKNFALPGKKAYPINDRSHAANALARVSQYGTPAQKAQVRAKVHAKYPGMGKPKRHERGGKKKRGEGYMPGGPRPAAWNVPGPSWSATDAGQRMMGTINQSAKMMRKSEHKRSWSKRSEKHERKEGETHERVMCRGCGSTHSRTYHERHLRTHHRGQKHDRHSSTALKGLKKWASEESKERGKKRHMRKEKRSEHKRHERKEEKRANTPAHQNHPGFKPSTPSQLQGRAQCHHRKPESSLDKLKRGMAKLAKNHG